jgi:predicted NUDIX family NTP pyrophosphohydrolase
MENCGGLILYRKIESSDELEFFLAHPGGPYYKHKDYWVFPKGGIEECDKDQYFNEYIDGNVYQTSYRNTAIREYVEETGDEMPIKLGIIPIYYGNFKQRVTKRIFVFFHKCTWDLKPENCFSNTIEIEYHGKIITIPENDDYKWMTYDELKNKTHEKHLKIYQNIIKNYKNFDY